MLHHITLYHPNTHSSHALSTGMRLRVILGTSHSLAKKHLA